MDDGHVLHSPWPHDSRSRDWQAALTRRLARQGNSDLARITIVALEAMATVGIDPQGATIAVQGFGKVGRYTARFLSEEGALVVAVSDQHGGVFNVWGLDIQALERHADLHGTVRGFEGGEELASQDELLTLAVDVLVPAAIEGVINHSNADQIRARIIVEGANGPTTRLADKALSDRGVLVVPDILANSGGVVVSCFDWVQANQAFWWSEWEVEERLAARMTLAWKRTTDFATSRGLDLRTAATTLAVEAVADAHQKRGLYP